MGSSTRKMMLPTGSRVSQCGGCGQLFNSVSAFDKHRAGDADHRRCLTPAEMHAAGMSVNNLGRWIGEADSNWRDGDE